MSRPRPRVRSVVTRGRVHRAAGFTLIELVVTLTLIGIIAGMAVPRFVGNDPFVERGYFEQSLGTIAHARQLAASSGCDVKVVFSSAGFSIEQWSVCSPSDHTTSASPVSRPEGGSYVDSTPSGLTVGSLSFYYDSLGRPRQLVASSPAPAVTSRSALSLTIGSRQLQVEPETGLVYMP